MTAPADPLLAALLDAAADELPRRAMIARNERSRRMDDLSLSTLSFWSSLTADEQAELDAKIAAREAVFTAEINRVRDAADAWHAARHEEGTAAFVAALERGDELLKALQNLVAAVEAAREAEDNWIRATDETAEQTMRASEDTEATVIIRENEARAAIAKAVQP